MYLLLGISLIFALLLVLNLLISAAATVLWRALAPLSGNWSASRRARIIFALRIFPFAAALIFVSGVILPSYLLFEPPASGESVSIKLAVLASVSALGVCFAFYRVFGTWWKTRRLLTDWLRHAEQIRIKDVETPIFRMNHPFPVIAVVGTFRPKIFVARQIFASLGEAEIQAAILHEFGHLAARDNFKRTIMRVCRDFLFFPLGRGLDRAWAENAESAADEYAAQTGGNLAAVNLAAALVKIARIIPAGAKPTMPAGAFLLTAQTDFVTCRVRRLLQLSEKTLDSAESSIFGLGISFRLILLPVFASILLMATNYNFLRQAHAILENIVGILQ